MSTTTWYWGEEAGWLASDGHDAIWSIIGELSPGVWVPSTRHNESLDTSDLHHPSPPPSRLDAWAAQMLMADISFHHSPLPLIVRLSSSGCMGVLSGFSWQRCLHLTSQPQRVFLFFFFFFNVLGGLFVALLISVALSLSLTRSPTPSLFLSLP